MINRILGVQNSGDARGEKLSSDDSRDATMWKRAGKNVVSKLEETISEHPFIALSVAVATGLSLGWLVKRR